MKRRHEKPLPRTNPSGKRVYVARWTDHYGKRHSAGTFELKREAQAAIDAAYDAEQAAPEGGRRSIGDYAANMWLQRHPRTERTTVCYEGRLRAVLDVRIERRKLRDWPLGEFRRRQAVQLLDVLLREQKRAAAGAKGVLLALSALYTDAIEDDETEANPFVGLRVRASDPRVQKPPRRPIIVSWEDMHRFAAVCGQYEPMVRVLSDCGLRIGEMFPLEHKDRDGDWLEIRKTAWRGRVWQGTKTDHGEANAGRRVPVAPALLEMLAQLPRRIDTRLMFPSPSGQLWSRDFYRQVWEPAQKATGLTIRPHDMRHSWVSLLRAAGIDPTYLASISGHTALTATQIYTHVTPDPGGVRAQMARDAVGG